MSVLFISNEFFKSEKNGGVVINNRNYLALKQLFNDEIEVYPVNDKTFKQKIINLLTKGSYSNLINKDLEKIINIVENKNCEYIFISSSLFGYILSTLNNKFYNLKSIVFYHNIEKSFRKDMYLSEKNKIKKIFKYLLYINYCSLEKKATKAADYLITLNQRDAEEVEKIYNRKINIILPTTLEDQYTGLKSIDKNQKELLFVGSNFFGNTQGLEWFLDEIYPDLKDVKLTVVGKGMEYLNSKYSFENLQILGYIENIEEAYAKANAVILPIISGSGMKTKTAEAMMYGKYMFATDEALVGYESYIQDSFVDKCNTKEEFINSIKQYLEEDKDSFNQNSRRAYENNFTLKSTVKKLEFLLEKKNVL